MKYRHSYHAGNFADVHKHVTLLALIKALQRKEKGFLYLDTHAGRGRYELNRTESVVARLSSLCDSQRSCSPELLDYCAAVAQTRKHFNHPRAYAGSPLLALHALRPQDRAVFLELEAQEARALQSVCGNDVRVKLECGDGFARMRAHLPPPERRGLTLIDPPYEESTDFAQAHVAIADAIKRFSTGVIAWWYPIKDARQIESQHARLAAQLSAPALICELWLYPRDSRVALNGSGLVIVNPPYQIEERMRVWLPELQRMLRVGEGSGTSVRSLADRV